MGAVAVLHPQDCLKDHRDALFPTPVKSRRTPKPSPNYSSPSPNSTRSEGRKRSPKNNRATATIVADPPAAAVAKNLVMGQVKILKRGEALDEPSTVPKNLNDRKVSNSTASSPPKDVKVPKDSTGGRKVLPAKKKAEKEKKRISNSSPKIEILKVDDFSLSSTDRLGPDPEMVPKQMKNIAEFFFAGSVFVDSPPPSSLPLPGFFTKSFVAAEKDDPSTYLRRILGLNLS